MEIFVVVSEEYQKFMYAMSKTIGNRIVARAFFIYFFLFLFGRYFGVFSFDSFAFSARSERFSDSS